MVIGTFAYCGSGQDTLADSICKLYGYKKYSVGDLIRKIATDNGLPQTRENLRQIRRKYDTNFGRDYFPNMLVKQIKRDDSNNIIITGIRTMQEYYIFRDYFKIKIIFVYADSHIRLQRMLKRQEEKDEESMDLLRKQMEKESQMFDYDELQTVNDIFFDFNITLEMYRKQEYDIVNSLLMKLSKEEGKRK